MTGERYSHLGLLTAAPYWQTHVVKALHGLVLPHGQAVNHPEHDGLQGAAEEHRQARSQLALTPKLPSLVQLTLTMNGTMSMTSASSS